MHIAYSAIRNNRNAKQSPALARYQGYLSACQKHEQTIAEIRKYMPEFTPQHPARGVSSGQLAVNNQ
ncbi:hypothetical protein [Mucilaginibacter myungsuensis]|uniref:Uncharacterized protein n=1 Tax=Mucilaginibacter myungsuensis TaxID=649104 RepID=A0A929KVP2_9SPHI|nr:hypothetical protein [Mucilaginibacter myungsuensis]MBE9662007.1 hypothetical protein [Mucilaginibacter myungsuensis]MDN3599560.1 hypothetical protein [Mucilaginibacter myungsuensis]